METKGILMEIDTRHVEKPLRRFNGGFFLKFNLLFEKYPLKLENKSSLTFPFAAVSSLQFLYPLDPQ